MLRLLIIAACSLLSVPFANRATAALLATDADRALQDVT